MYCRYLGVGLSYFAKLEKDELAEQEKENSGTEVEHNDDGDAKEEPIPDINDEDESQRTEEDIRFETLGNGFEVVKKFRICVISEYGHYSGTWLIDVCGAQNVRCHR